MAENEVAGAELIAVTHPTLLCFEEQGVIGAVLFDLGAAGAGRADELSAADVGHFLHLDFAGLQSIAHGDDVALEVCLLLRVNPKPPATDAGDEGAEVVEVAAVALGVYAHEVSIAGAVNVTLRADLEALAEGYLALGDVVVLGADKVGPRGAVVVELGGVVALVSILHASSGIIHLNGFAVYAEPVEVGEIGVLVPVAVALRGAARCRHCGNGHGVHAALATLGAPRQACQCGAGYFDCLCHIMPYIRAGTRPGLSL